MTINQLHEPMQSAYTECHSTETVLVQVQNYILRTLDQGGAAILVLLNLSAAFVTINHSILLSRMASVLGVKGSALQWFKSCLLLSLARTDVSVASESVRNLEAMFDSQMIMAPHVKSVVKKSSFHLRNIWCRLHHAAVEHSGDKNKIRNYLNILSAACTMLNTSDAGFARPPLSFLIVRRLTSTPVVKLPTLLASAAIPPHRYSIIPHCVQEHFCNELNYMGK